MIITARGTLYSSPRKVNLVASLIRGRSVADAEVILAHTPKAAATLLAKLLKSARSNAEHNHDLRLEDLTISQIMVGSGIVFRRGRAASRGRYHPFRRRTSNVVIEVTAADKPAKPPAKAATKATKKEDSDGSEN